MKNLIAACLLSVSCSAVAVTQITSTYTDINFNVDDYVNIEILNKRVYMTVDPNKKYDFNEHVIEVPIKLEWATQRGVNFTASCTSPTSSELCADNGLVKFPLIGMPFMDADIYREGKTKTYGVDGTQWRIYKGDHKIRIGISDISEFIDDYQKVKESIFIYKIFIEANI